jgi:hypothetical protein
VAKKPLGFFRVPPGYAQMSEEERHAHAEVIADKIREAILAQGSDAEGTEDETEAPGRHDRHL